ncbi:MarR family winged helix-turn-helix transcriptional regulator [Ornithinimicrobium cryptoxanthini]|uniref:MarR family transcriptional regulator n=1 Tax=Ornithinimicrobium cryptoxanthini TaxID=2934161 RepID=A0ABY4YJA2_9MICO|nr:MarR family transcriptional regulator [Ornithinimicrobium cryptoxanthini]USQ76778.1 MarR family transcriptional regulator [Ornithinimicrobium cryptoxanthini]
MPDPTPVTPPSTDLRGPEPGGDPGQGGTGTDSPQEIARLAHDLRIACMRVSRRVRFETTSTIAPHQLSVIVRLAESSYSSGELASIERVSAPSMSRTVTALVELGMVERATDSDDARVVRLSLTPAGRRELDVHRARRDAWMTERLDGLTSEERQLLAGASHLLNRVFDQ